jgi:peptidoglycan/LPS O-acetylase OafA/YrhL
MTATVRTDSSRSRGLRGVLAGAWGMVSGIAPHVLHHVGPLAGAALLAGTGGRVLFFLIGLAVAVPMLILLYRRFRTWVAPAIAVVIFAAAYTVSTLFLGPLFTGNAEGLADSLGATTTTHPHGH